MSKSQATAFACTCSGAAFGPHKQHFTDLQGVGVHRAVETGAAHVDLSLDVRAAQIRYSPELQPAETLWALVDEPIVNKHIATIKELEEKIASQCVALANRLPLVATADRSELITRKPYE